MRIRVLLSLLAVSIAATTLVSASGAGATKLVGVPTIDVSTRATVIQYLRMIHIDPRGVVIQRGVRNYAGASCPGRGWSCTSTAHPVVQVAAAGGQNTFSCSTPRCAVVQVATKTLAANTAKCVKTTGLGQSCTISQSSSSSDNVAIVYEDATKLSGLTQTATSAASITQQATGASNMNTACVTQNIHVDGTTVAKNGTPVTVTLDAHQNVTIKQDAVGSGANSAAQAATSAGACTGSAITQNQTVTSTANSAGSITQNENAANNGANVTVDIEQNQGAGHGLGSGTNNAAFVQTNSLSATANSTAGPVAQTQSSLNGGLLGTINQDSTGVSTATATQTETQCEDAAKTGLTHCDTTDADASEAPVSLTQTQFGPVQKGIGTATQTGNSGDTFTVTQSSTQNNDQGSGSNQTNVIHGDCSTPGNCTVNQTTNVDGQQSTNNQTGQNVNTSTTCTGSTCIHSGNNVLIAGAGDHSISEPNPTDPNDSIAGLLTQAGYTVTESATLPADLSGFDEVWWVDISPPTLAEQNQLIAFAESGRGVFLTGERPCCEDLNTADQAIVNSVVAGGGITVGGQGDVCNCISPLPVNPGVLGGLATQPFTVTTWQPAGPGGIAGVSGSSVFAYYQASEESPQQVVAAAWDRPSIVGNGRLVLFMDINWAETGAGFAATNWSDVAQNVALFLSGLSSPPGPAVTAEAPASVRPAAVPAAPSTPAAGGGTAP